MAPKKTIEKTKKPLSGYMKFAKERRPTLLKSKPNLSFGEVRGITARGHRPWKEACPQSLMTLSPLTLCTFVFF